MLFREVIKRELPEKSRQGLSTDMISHESLKKEATL
jgi:hypothetical protein